MENKLTLGAGATPLTVAELVVRECSDEEFLEDVVYFINCYIERNRKSRLVDCRAKMQEVEK